jgi:hypothetical protein
MSARNERLRMTEQQTRNFARLKAAAERGDADAACRLGDRYREGLDGLRYSPRQAFHWYARSATAGDAWGQNNLGACYEHEIGCAQSYPNAVKWYRRAVAQGNATSHMNLAYCYLSGHGVPADKLEALRLFREAVERGEERAVHEVERLEETLGVRGWQLASAITYPDAAPDVCSASPTGTQQARPCVLALGVPPRDGLWERLQPSATVQSGLPDSPSEQRQPSEPKSKAVVTNIRPVIVHQICQPGTHFGSVGVGGARPRSAPAERWAADHEDGAERCSGDGRRPICAGAWTNRRRRRWAVPRRRIWRGPKRRGNEHNAGN